MKSLKEQLDIIASHRRSVPVKLDELAENLGIGVHYVDMGEDSGMIKRSGRTASGFECHINAKHPSVRQRFTLAHEIAHAVLHPHLIGDGIKDDVRWRSGLPDVVEYQANRMAADILMPFNLVRKYAALGKSTEELAREFGVSKRAMEIRLEALERQPEFA